MAKVTADGRFKTLDDLRKALKVEPTGALEPVEGVDYEITYGEVKNNKVTVTVAGKGNHSRNLFFFRKMGSRLMAFFDQFVLRDSVLRYNIINAG